MALTRSTLALTRRLRRDIGSETDDADRHLTRQWVEAWDRLAPTWSRAVTELAAAAVTSGQWPNVHQIARSSAMDALEASRAELDKLSTETDTTASAGAERVVELDTELEPRIIASQAPETQQEALTAHLVRRLAEQEEEPDITDGGMVPLPTAADVLGQVAIAGLIAGRFEPSALAAIIARAQGQIHADTYPLSAAAEQAMKDALIEGVIVGDHPEPIARDMLARVEQAFNGGLTRALTISRTEMLDAYRASSAYTHRANSDLVTGWQWYASTDSKTCFPAGTLIRTRRGEIPIETVNIGDEVLTHAGRWRRVYETLSRPYTGRLVTVEAGPLRVTATANHPFLIEREGRLEWIAAGDVRVGDSILSDRKLSSNEVGHRFGEVAVKRCGDQTDHIEPAADEEDVLAGIPLSNLVMPVGLIDFEHSVQVGQKEVHRATPSFDGFLLDEGDTERLQGETDVSLGDGLPGVPAVAAHRAEPLVTQRGQDPELLPAGEAVVDDRRATARLAAMTPIGIRCPEPLPTSLAVSIGRVGVFASAGADDVALVGSAVDGEDLPAQGAGLRDGMCRCAAGVSAEPSGATGRGQEVTVAVGANTGDFWSSFSTAPAVGVGELLPGVAGSGAVFGSASANPSLGGFESSSTGFASPLHRTKITGRYDIPAVLRVHNLEVEEDHSYIAEGFAVHNCAACFSRHGTIHPISEPGPDDHPRGRCTRLPVLKTWEELGITATEPPPIALDGEKAFRRMSKADQLEVMGPARLALLDSGDITWGQLATWRNNPAWRRSNQPTTVRDLKRAANQEVTRVS